MSSPLAGATISYQVHVVGKWSAPDFHRCRVAAEFLASTRSNVKATIEGYFETQYEMRLKRIVRTFGSAFFKAKPSATLVYVIADATKALYFASEDRFFEWAAKRFKYADSTSLILYKRMGNKALLQHYAQSRNYCALVFQFGGKEEEQVQLELFTKECPRLCANFLNLVKSGKLVGTHVHRIKQDCYVQAGDVVDSSGMHSISAAQAAAGELNAAADVPDDSFKYKHTDSGFLGSCNSKLDSNGSQFYVTLRDLPSLDGRFVIFGRVIAGMRSIWKMSKLETNYCGRPHTPVAVTQVVENILEMRIASVGGPLEKVVAGSGNATRVSQTNVAGTAATTRETEGTGQTERTDEEEEKQAAVKMQALYRGRLGRKRVTDMKISYVTADQNAASAA